MDGDILVRLRNAAEDDVIAAIEGKYVEDVLDGIAPDVLLKFFLRIIGQVIGEEET